jgi:hypothetical protein
VDSSANKWDELTQIALTKTIEINSQEVKALNSVEGLKVNIKGGHYTLNFQPPIGALLNPELY